MSKYYDMKGTEHIVSDKITEDNLKAIQEAYTYIQNFLNETDHYIMVLENIWNFIACIQSLEKSKYEEETKFIQMNRHFMNYLNAFYSWKCFHGHESSYQHKKEYEDIKEKYQKQNLIYGLADALRNFSTHNGFAISTIEYDVLKEKTAYWITPLFYDDMKKLKPNGKSKINSLLKNHITQLQQTGIEAYTFTLAFQKTFIELQQTIWDFTLPEICKKIKVISSVAAPTAPDCYNSYIVSTHDDEFNFGIGRILELYSRRMETMDAIQKINTSNEVKVCLTSPFSP